MSSRRALKAAQAIREVVSTAILLELKDPRVNDATVTMVEVSGDLRAAKVYVSVMGDETKQNLCVQGLRSSIGFLQKRVGNRIDTRYVPKLSIVLDKGAMNAMEVTRILKEVLPEGSSDDDPAAASPTPLPTVEPAGFEQAVSEMADDPTTKTSPWTMPPPGAAGPPDSTDDETASDSDLSRTSDSDD